ncbi:hypothetical protein PIIN_02910 [Serendipita indica DSM 11827]|uniref:Reverse transcriptase zinc-binding domain-containing protein n=1 Tax=Serendipita indica (strain DSM 11827) TaxID=1109443 RepID=G4TCK9_SERID|nr:hypothetical protein PIIN_02910 [Serendipita indica DSM 11827]
MMTFGEVRCAHALQTWNRVNGPTLSTDTSHARIARITSSLSTVMVESKDELISLVTQVRIGHGYFGEYYAHFKIPERSDCPCGTEIQIREHILYDCPLFNDARHTLYSTAPDGHIGSLLGIKKGIEGLASFLKFTNAFRKRPEDDEVQ